MRFSAIQIANLIDGELDGNPDIFVENLSKIEEGKPNTITFLANPKYEDFIYNTEASLVLVNKNFIPLKPLKATLIRVNDPYRSFATLLEEFNKKRRGKTGIEQPSFVSVDVNIGENVYIGAFSYIGENVVIGNNVKIYPQVYIGDNVRIGDNTIIFAGVKIYHECEIGKNCTIHSGSVIGSDGFGFAPQSNEQYLKIAQIGNVVIEDCVEIGANTTIDRATIGSTLIKKGVKLDNLIQIAHNVEIGANTVIAAQSGVAGSTKIGEYCMIGGQVGIIGHLNIAAQVKVAAQSGIGTDIKKVGEVLQGSPAFKIMDYRKSYVAFKNLPEISKRINVLEKELEKIKTKSDL
jgi:UDP-3-O-[3-hydroxymyristoyl] glucosamine N-acyltransferase